MVDLLVFPVAVVLGFLAGLGVGGGSLLMLWLTTVIHMEYADARIINLLFFLPVGLIAVIIYAIKRKIKWKTVLFMATGGVLGAVLGLSLTGWIGGNLTAKLFGALLVFLGIKEIIIKKNKKENKP